MDLVDGSPFPLDVSDFIEAVGSRCDRPRVFDRLQYPFLHPLARVDTSLGEDQLLRVDHMARIAWGQVASLDVLRSWVRRSPSSWLIARDGLEIRGYAHVEPLNASAAKDIIGGRRDESQIRGSDIPEDSAVREDDYIHIGAIVKDSSGSVGHTTARLMAGIIDRILDLRLMNESDVHLLLAVDYPDSSGRHHATPILRNLGFTREGVDREGNGVYVGDLRSLNKRARSIIDMVLFIRCRSRARSAKRAARLRYVLMAVAFVALVALMITGSWSFAVIGTASVVVNVISLLLGKKRAAKWSEDFGKVTRNIGTAMGAL